MPGRYLAAATALAASAAPSLAAAADAVSPAEAAPDFGASVMQMLFGLGLVLALMVVLYWLMRRFLPGATGGAGSRARVVGRLALGARKSVALVEVAGKVLVLGVGGDSITLLDKVEEPERVAELTKGGGGFAGALKKASDAEESR